MEIIPVDEGTISQISKRVSFEADSLVEVRENDG